MVSDRVLLEPFAQSGPPSIYTSRPHGRSITPPERRRKWVQAQTERRLLCRSPSPALRRPVPSLNNHYDLPNIHRGIRHGQVTQMRDKYFVVNFIMSLMRE